MPGDQPHSSEPAMCVAAYGGITELRNLSAQLFEQFHLCSLEFPSGELREGFALWGSRAVLEQWLNRLSRDHR